MQSQIKIILRLSAMSFLEFAVWGAYLTSMSNYMGSAGLGMLIPWFFAIQGLVCLITPPVIGILADRYIAPVHLLSACQRDGRRVDGYVLVVGILIAYARQGDVYGDVHAKLGILHADSCIEQHDCIQGDAQPWHRHGEGFPKNQGVGHDRIYLCHGVCQFRIIG